MRLGVDDIIKVRPSEKHHFQAYIFDLPTLMGMLAKNSHAELSKNEISQEVLDVFPLYLELIRKTKRRWLIGKLSEQDHPYDVFMAPEEYVVKNGRRVHIQASSFVQTK